MKRTYKIIILIVFIITVCNLLYNLFSINKSHFKKEELEKNNSRYVSRILSEKIVGDKITELHLINIISDQKQKIEFNVPTIVILISKLGCSECSNRELKNLKSLNQKLGNKINIIGIFSGMDRNDALKLKKVNNVGFNFFWGEKIIFTEFSIADSYPQIFVIKNNLIISSFLPIPRDDKFSKWYFSSLEKKYSKWNKN